MIGSLTIAEYFNFIDHSSNRINTAQRLWTFPLRIGIPFFLIYVIAKEFVNNRIKAIHNAEKLINHQNELNTKIAVSEKFYRSILEEAEDIIFELNAKGYYSYVNPAGLKLTGYTRAELYQMSFMDCLFEADRRKHQRQLVQQLNNGISTSYMQFRIHTKTGEVIWIGQTTKIIFDDRGNYQRSFCVARNITKQEQEKLILKQAKEEAVRLNQAKNNFLAMMGHELRTPLNAIIGLGYNLLDNQHTEAQKEDLKTILFSSNNLLNLINDILDFTLIEQSKFILKKKAFDLSEILQQTVNAYHAQLHGALSVELNMDKAVPTQLIGDVGRLLQILNNLLQNAIKFTKQGTVAINVKLQSFKENQPQIYFEVKDTGIGIAASNLDNIFKRFTQLDNSLKRNYGGMGLGLSIVRKLLNKMDSEIHVTSELGQGSIFFFTLSFAQQSI
ncbi:MAG: ATP-binding protein, partial [Saprospiraceae bacterium]